MSAEKIIERIKNDAEKQREHIIDEAEKQSKILLKTTKAQAEKDAELLLRNGRHESDNAKKILVSKAIQDVRKDMMKAKEEMIELCFSEALEKLGSLPDDQYRKFVITLIRAGKKRLGEE